MAIDIRSSGVGIILLHPFFIPLFTQQNLLRGEQFISNDARWKAFKVLQYITSGNNSAAEGSELFLKLLCGVTSSVAISEMEALSGEEMDEIQECLESFIAQWPGLRNTSMDSLRSSFFQRQASLSIDGDRIKIYLEGSPIDILLDQYPWNVSIIKLPWMKSLLHVSIG